MKATRETKPFPHTKFTTNLPPSERKVENMWGELVDYLAWTYLDPEKWAWAFRGISRHEYRLESKLERELKGRTGSDYNIDRQTAEDYLLSQFKRAAHHFAEPSMVPGKDDTLEWLALMQHYGAPTRLLDFTRYPYVACFFALKIADTKDCCAIWAIDTNWIVAKSLSRVERKLPGHHGLAKDSLFNSGFVSQYFRRLFVKNSAPMILPIVPSRSSELHYMNISQASLFPSLEGFATSLAHELVYKSSDEIERSR